MDNNIIKRVDLTTPSQKIIAGVGLFCFGVLLYYLLPPLVMIFKNLIFLSIFTVVLLFIAMNYRNIWEFSKQLTWKLTKNRISSDKLYYMYRYHDYLVQRLAALDDNIKNVTAIRSKASRRLQETIKTHKDNLDKAIAYEQAGQSKLVIDTAYRKVDVDQKAIDTLAPKVEAMEKQESYLKELYDAWAADIEQFKYTIDNKAEEYTLLKEMANSTGSASEFLKGNSVEFKEFQESMIQIENSVNVYIGTIDSFERKVSPILQTLAANQAISEQAGKTLLEEYKKSRVDFSSQQ